MKIRYIRNWRNRPHPYFFYRNWDSMMMLDIGPVEIIRKK